MKKQKKQKKQKMKTNTAKTDYTKRTVFGVLTNAPEKLTVLRHISATKLKIIYLETGGYVKCYKFRKYKSTKKYRKTLLCTIPSICRIFMYKYAGVYRNISM